MQTVSFSESRCSIGDETFKGCDELTTVTLGKVTSIGDECFKDCDHLKEILFETSVKQFDLNIFLDVFIYTAFERYRVTNQEFSFKAYRYAIQQKQKILNKTITREAFMLNFLDYLWEVAH